MKKLQLYKYATWGLLFLNITLIAFFFLTKPKPPHHKGGEGFQKRVIELLNLDEQQQRLFLTSAEQHNQKMRSIDLQQRNVLKPYFQSLIDTSIISNSKSVQNQIQLLEWDKIQSTYHHFQEVKLMLNPKQQSKFEPFLNKALELILLEQKNNPKPPKDF